IADAVDNVRARLGELALLAGIRDGRHLREERFLIFGGRTLCAPTGVEIGRGAQRAPFDIEMRESEFPQQRELICQLFVHESSPGCGSPRRSSPPARSSSTSHPAR